MNPKLHNVIISINVLVIRKWCTIAGKGSVSSSKMLVAKLLAGILNELLKIGIEVSAQQMILVVDDECGWSEKSLVRTFSRDWNKLESRHVLETLFQVSHVPVHSQECPHLEDHLWDGDQIQENHPNMRRHGEHVANACHALHNCEWVNIFGVIEPTASTNEAFRRFTAFPLHETTQ